MTLETQKMKNLGIMKNSRVQSSYNLKCDLQNTRNENNMYKGHVKVEK